MQLLQDAAASLARVNAAHAQQMAAKDAEIQSLRQIVLETKEQAAKKVRTAIEEYQTRSNGVEER